MGTSPLRLSLLLVTLIAIGLGLLFLNSSSANSMGHMGDSIDATAASVALSTSQTNSQNLYLPSIGYDSRNSRDWIGRPALIALPDGRWILFYRKGTAHGVADGKVHLRFSEDQGNTWSDEDETPAGAEVIGFPIGAQPGNNDSGGPVVGLAANGDLILHSHDSALPGLLRRGIYQYRSTTNGATWTSEGKVNQDDSILAGGQIILIGATLYMVGPRDPGADGLPPYESVMHKSTDNGATWTLVSIVIGTHIGANESSIAHTGGNNLLVIARSDSETKTYMRRSTDLGVTWGPVRNVTGTFGVVQRPLLKYIGDRLYLCGREREQEYAARTALWFSDDDGLKWEGPYHWNTTLFADTGHCDFLERSDGTIYGVTYEGTDDAASLSEYVNQCVVGGCASTRKSSE
jgi:hypothetical protein